LQNIYYFRFSMKQRFINLGQVISTAITRFFHRKRLIRYAVYLGILLILYLCRVPILRGFGNYLMPEDTIENADAVYVLGGSSYDRSKKAAEIYKDGYARYFYCTGGHPSKEFELLDTMLTEAEITASFLLRNGIPGNKISPIKKGLSTRDEAELIYIHARKKKYDQIIILSSLLHLRRVRNVFEKKFSDSGIQLIFIGAPSSEYDESEWWKYEKGLIMVNNEYVKLFYYWWTE